MEDLATFKDQLALVNLQLEADPGNDDLLKLQAEFHELIALTEAALASSKPKDKGKGKEKEREKEKEVPKESSSNWQELGEYRAGMDCMAKYKDGKFYPARINQVVGTQESPLYTITFKGYSSSTNVPLSSLKPHDPTAPIPTPQPQKRRHDQLSDKEKEKKKKKGEKWMATQKEKADVAKKVQNDWQKFGKKAQKKGYHIAGLEGKSVFRTSDSVHGRVGVFNSGKGVTEYERLGKHKFDKLDEE